MCFWCFSWSVTMSKSRDRLPRPMGYEAIFVGWRVAGARFFILEDPKTSQNFTTPATRGGWFKSNGFGKPRSVGRRVRSRSPTTGKENAPIFSRGSVRDKPRRSVLPSWYLRVPLQDITWVMRVIMLLFLQPFDTLRNNIGLFVFKCDLNWDSFPFW